MYTWLRDWNWKVLTRYCIFNPFRACDCYGPRLTRKKKGVSFFESAKHELLEAILSTKSTQKTVIVLLLYPPTVVPERLDNQIGTWLAGEAMGKDAKTTLE